MIFSAGTQRYPLISSALRTMADRDVGEAASAFSGVPHAAHPRIRSSARRRAGILFLINTLLIPDTDCGSILFPQGIQPEAGKGCVLPGKILTGIKTSYHGGSASVNRRRYISPSGRAYWIRR